MLYNLMNTDKVVLKFDMDEMYIEVIDNDFLPYELKDFVKTTEPTIEGIKKTAKDISVLKDFFVSRTLDLSRENAKVILNCATLPQSLKTEEKLKITFYCSGLTMTDNFWIKKEDDVITFEDVNLRNHRLSEASYEIAILGKHISATRDELKPDLSTDGMFPKYWTRLKNGVYLYKTDKYDNNVSVNSEIMYCNYLEEMGISCVHYDLVEKDGNKFAVSRCIANDNYSLIHAQSIKDWCEHTDRNFDEFVKENFVEDFANMCLCDYVFANTDRHFNNWGFTVDNNTNQIVKFAPLFDHNQSFLSDYYKTDIDELIYEPCGKNFIESVKEMFAFATVDFKKANGLSNECLKRLSKISIRNQDGGNGGNNTNDITEALEENSNEERDDDDGRADV